MGSASCCDEDGLKKGPWTPEEDKKLIDYISINGCGNWRTLPKKAGLQRCGKSCRLRWTNYLRPDIKRGKFSPGEEETIIHLHSILGNKWSSIASKLPGRTDNEIKNYWNTHIRKKLLRMGIDPVTHSPRLDLLDLSSILNSSLYSSNISRLLGVQNLVNPDLMRQLLLPNYHNRNYYNVQNHQNPCSNQFLNNGSNQVQAHQTPVQDLSTAFHGNDQLQSSCNNNGALFPMNAVQEDYVPAITGYYGTDQCLADQSESSNFQSNLSFQCSLPNSSSPSSIEATPLIYAEDERESYCSDDILLNHEMHDLWGTVNDFM